MSKRKLLLLHFLLIFVIEHSYAQLGWDSLTIQSYKRIFFSFTYNFTPDFEQSPYSITPNFVTEYNYNTNPSPTLTIVKVGNMGMRQFTTNFESVGFKGRLNAIEFSKISSLSITCNPSLGFGFSLLEQSPPTASGGISGYGSLDIPLFLDFNYGGGATLNNQEEYGIFAFAGAEFIKAPLIQLTIPAELVMDDDGSTYYAKLTNYWFEPAAGFGVRYKDGKKRLREIYLKYGMGASNLFIGPSGYYPVSGHPWTLKLTFTRTLWK
jgi:hypothetical protein